MKKSFYLLLLFSLFSSKNSFSQNEVSKTDIKETLDWLNQKFYENKIWRSYTFEKVEFFNNEPYLIMVIKPGNCNDVDICKIPLKKIDTINYELWGIKSSNDTYELTLNTKNEEKIVWYQRDENCGQIGDKMTISLNPTIENDDLKNRIKNALNHLLFLYGNDGKEKF